jgi:ATP-binding cassette, subfamily F, member 3
MIQIDNITLRVAGRVLLENAAVSIPGGARVGLVGRNGTGKTTLFRAISGEIGTDTGEIRIARGLRIGQVAQEAPGTQEPLIDIVLAADIERSELLAAAECETEPHRIAEIHTRLADIDAHSAEARAAAILSGLGFPEQIQRHPASSFSGGWRMRIALAGVLFSRPDILLLDEPTNYLDLEGSMWLETYLGRYTGTVIVISHDRDLLNVATNSILHLENKNLTFYRGNFDSFARQRAERAELAQKAAAKQAARAKHLQAFVDRFRAKASKARQAQSRIKMLEKLQPIELAAENRSAAIRFRDPEKLLSSPIIRLEDVSGGYAPDRPVLRDLSLRIDQDDRIALLGANGNGKSTFAKLLCGRLDYVAGNITRAPNLKVGMFAQHQLEELIPEHTAVEHVRARLAGLPESALRSRVAQMGLDTARMDTRARDLSGGEKARLMLGLAMLEGPHLIILDEPTNHLDMEAREALMMALNDYNGAVILVSHDRYLVETCADRLWLVEDGGVHAFDGDIDDYRARVLSRRRGRKDTTSGPERAPELSGAERRREEAERRRQLAPLARRIQEAETAIDKLRKAIASIDEQLSDAEWFSTNPDRGSEYAKIRAEAEKRLVMREDEWLQLSGDYEARMRPDWNAN